MRESVDRHTAWCGFVNDRPDIDALKRYPNGNRNDGYGTLYRTKREALKFYQDVRRVNLYEVFAP